MNTHLRNLWYRHGDFLPTHFDNLERWLEPGLQTGLNDNDSVDQVTDHSGNGKHITASGANRGIYKTNIINGRAILRLDGTRRYNSINGSSDDNFKHQGDFTIIKLVYLNVDDSTHTFFDSGITNASSTGFLSQFKLITSGVTGGYQTLVANGTGTYLVERNLERTSDGRPCPKNTWILMTERFEQAKTREHFTCETENLLRGRSTKSGSPSAGASTAAPAWFSTTAGTAKGNFDLAFLAEYSRALTDDELNKLIGRSLTLAT